MSLPRLLAGIDGAGAMSLAAHSAVHGDLPLESHRLSRDAHGKAAVIEELRGSGLTGRGGAAFPLARKLASVAAGRDRPVVVVNACEGEPASEKDRLLLERLPHLVIDGALTCARTVDSDRIIFAIDANHPTARWAVEAALAERSDTGRRGLAAEVLEIPAGYVSGQESAIVNHLNGGRAVPTAAPPMVFERGVGRRPTLVSNAETLGHVALIVRHGADWFRELGTPTEPGSLLVTLGGAVAEPGVFEIEPGAPLDWLLSAAGGTLEPARAFLFGGYGGGWVDAGDAADLEIAGRPLRELGASLGPGVIVALPESACPVAETARVAAWLESQSARQCGPCVHGLAAIAGALHSIAAGAPEPDVLTRLTRWAGLVTGRGACGHPDGAARFVASSLRVFAAEFADHAAHGPCTACLGAPVLPLPARVAVPA
jgi:NADH:ubiquinone oxidoreductase subunit F (NADH-binding)